MALTFDKLQFRQVLKTKITPAVDSRDQISAELKTLAEALSGQTKLFVI